MWPHKKKPSSLKKKITYYLTRTSRGCILRKTSLYCNQSKGSITLFAVTFSPGLDKYRSPQHWCDVRWVKMQHVCTAAHWMVGGCAQLNKAQLKKLKKKNKMFNHLLTPVALRLQCDSAAHDHVNLHDLHFWVGGTHESPPQRCCFSLQHKPISQVLADWFVLYYCHCDITGTQSIPPQCQLV